MLQFLSQTQTNVFLLSQLLVSISLPPNSYLLAMNIKAWAKLNSLNRKMKGCEINSDNFSIGRAETNDLKIKD